MRHPQQPDNFHNTFQQKSDKVQVNYSQLRTELSKTLGLLDKLIEKDELSNGSKQDPQLNNRPSLR